MSTLDEGEPSLSFSLSSSESDYCFGMHLGSQRRIGFRQGRVTWIGVFCSGCSLSISYCARSISTLLSSYKTTRSPTIAVTTRLILDLSFSDKSRFVFILRRANCYCAGSPLSSKLFLSVLLSAMRTELTRDYFSPLFSSSLDSSSELKDECDPDDIDVIIINFHYNS